MAIIRPNGRAVRLEHRFRMEIPASPAEVFPLLCPVREHDWIEPWSCSLLYSTSGAAELGCTFMTDGCYWTTCTYEPPDRIGFALFAPARSVDLLTITLQAEGVRTSLEWHRVVTSVPGGDVEALHGRMAGYDRYHRALERALSHYVATGQRLSWSDAFGAEGS